MGLLRPWAASGSSPLAAPDQLVQRGHQPPRSLLVEIRLNLESASQRTAFFNPKLQPDPLLGHERNSGRAVNSGQNQTTVATRQLGSRNRLAKPLREVHEV